MTEWEARELLKKPIFGDDKCIKAKKFLFRLEKEKELREALLGKEVLCPCCNGAGSIGCLCNCDHECPTCGGNSGPKGLTLTQEFLEDMDLDLLEEFSEEINRGDK